jgi:hypothetical protein
MSKNAKAQTPTAPQRIEIADDATMALWVVQMNDHLRAAAEIGTRLFNEAGKRQAYINSLPKPEAP